MKCKVLSDKSLLRLGCLVVLSIVFPVIPLKVDMVKVLAYYGTKKDLSKEASTISRYVVHVYEFYLK